MNDNGIYFVKENNSLILTSSNMANLYKLYAEESMSDVVPSPSPDFNHYNELYDTGVMSIFCAYSNESVVGFAISITVKMLHYTALSTTVESIFVKKEFRNGTSIGSKLISMIKDDAKQRGASSIFMSAPVGSNADKLCKIQFKHISNLYGLEV